MCCTCLLTLLLRVVDHLGALLTFGVLTIYLHLHGFIGLK